MRMINDESIRAIAVASHLPPQAVLAAFRESTAEDMAHVRSAFAAGELDRLALHAHRMCGASEMVGAAVLAQGCRAVAAAIEGAEAQALSAAVDRLEATVAELARHIEQRRGG